MPGAATTVAAAEPSVESAIRPAGALRPSPSGDLHVGNIRTALYTWAYGRHHGGTFVFRIEDTDRSRVTDEHIHAAVDMLRWMGLDWDEGPEVGGPYAPYRQSQRLDVYADWARRFLDNGDAYHCYCSPEELAERREAQRTAGPTARLRRPLPVTHAGAGGRVRGRGPPPGPPLPDAGGVDDVHRPGPRRCHLRPPVRAGLRARSRGRDPLYTLAVAVDDVLMGSRTSCAARTCSRRRPPVRPLPRDGRRARELPEFGHLPLVLGAGQPAAVQAQRRRLDRLVPARRFPGRGDDQLPGAARLVPRRRPRVLLLDEMVEAFDLSRVNSQLRPVRPAEARGDQRRLDPRAVGDEFVGRITPFLAASRPGRPTRRPTRRRA